MSTQLDLLDTLQQLASKGGIRQIDLQFARFISEQAHDPLLGFIAGVVSSELGKGHICLPLFDRQGQVCDLAGKLGLYGDNALALNQQLVAVDWPTHLTRSPLVGTQGEAVPLMFDGERLYLHRYWHYEVTLAAKLNHLGAVALESDQQTKLYRLLDHLFARHYGYLFQALAQLESSTPVTRQQLICDQLDVMDARSVDWDAIDRCLLSAEQASDLELLETLVPNSVCVNWQKVAAAVALTRRFAVISGGPGTGKTTTVTKLLAALIEQAGAGAVPTIKLVAPTGKAAARLTESIGKAVQALPVAPSLKAQIPTEASTLHRLLGAVPGSVEFRHNQHNPLHLDILVVDEASMVDLSMMHKLVDALPAHARLILLGDKDQLASVEAGAVLGDICSFQSQGYSAAQGQTLAKLTGFDALAHNSQGISGIADSLCMLQKSYRFDARSGIGQLAKAVNSGQANQIEAVWQRAFADIHHAPLASDSYHQMLQSLVAEYGRYLTLSHQALDEFFLNGSVQTAADPSTLALSPEVLTRAMEQKAKGVLDTFNTCRLLCAVREGDFGVTGLNLRIEKALAARKLIQTQEELWYHGRPVMVTRNDHGLGLYNGDIGICLRDESADEPRLKVYFELPDGSVKAVLPSRVPEHETAYAMTIHKSQGSEFDFTLMILPPEFSPILTRELIYTGITRAKKRLALYADMNVLLRGVKVKTARASGLVTRLSQTA